MSPVVDFLKAVVTEVLFSIVALGGNLILHNVRQCSRSCGRIFLCEGS